MKTIKAITFDFWRTLFRDNGSDERRHMRMNAAVKVTGRPYEEVDPVMTSAMRAFTTIHVHERRTLSARDAVRMLGDGLGMTIEADNAKYLAEVFATAILAHPPLPIEGALEAVAAAAERYPIGIISDAGISPGSVLRVLLERHGFLRYFKTFAFSDEVGVSKPQRPMFERAAAGLDVEFADMLHIGDLEPTDIAGALAVGARAALFTGDNTRFLNNTNAHYTFTEWSQFRDSLAALD